MTFDLRNQGQRGALTLVNGIVYIVWAAHEDHDPYHGWVIGYDAASLAQVAVFNADPNGSRGGIWMAGGAPAVDASGNLYLSTGNGTFDGNSGTPPNDDFGDTVMKVGTSSGLSLVDWFTPFNQAYLNGLDLDLGSSGVVVLPDQTSGPAHLLVTGGKEGSSTCWTATQWATTAPPALRRTQISCKVFSLRRPSLALQHSGKTNFISVGHPML